MKWLKWLVSPNSHYSKLELILEIISSPYFVDKDTDAQGYKTNKQKRAD